MTSPNITVETVPARQLAAVRRRVTIGAVGTAWKPALDEVWAFLRAHADLRTDGHNVFVYHHPASREAPMDVDFGVEVCAPSSAKATSLRPKRRRGRSRWPCTSAPTTSFAARTTRSTRGVRRRAARSRARRREISGDWSDDPAKLETTVCYLLG